jgi:hypothetical protein
MIPKNEVFTMNNADFKTLTRGNSEIPPEDEQSDQEG